MPKTQKLPGRISAARQRAFLAAYRRTASVTRAARAARFDRALHYRWLTDDPHYAASFAIAQTQAGDSLEDEAIRRAHEGLAKPLVYQGQFQYRQRLKAGTGKGTGKRAVYENYGPPLAIQEYSDQLLMFLLKGFKPGKYRERGSLELSGPGGGPIALDAEDQRFKDLTDEDLEKLIAIASKLAPEAD